MEDIVIVGAGGFAKEVAFLIDDINKKHRKWNILGFVDIKKTMKNGKYSVVYNDNDLLNIDKEINVIFGIGDSNLILKLSESYKANKNIKFPNLIHPNVIGDFERISIGEGNIICASNIFTTDIDIGSFNIFNLNNTIGHDAIIGNFNVINPTCNISGGVNLGDKILLGTGSQVLQYVSITSNTIVGAGAVVTKNITENGVYVGSPAKKIK